MDHLRQSFQDVPYKEVLYTDEDGGFQTFPKRSGWTISEDYECSLTASGNVRIHQLDQLLQAWLFFGLLYTVLGKEVIGTVPGCFDHFIESNSLASCITTKALPRLLQDWHDRETDPSFENGRALRMIRAQMDLDLAHAVVKRYFTIEGQSRALESPPSARLDPGDILGLSLVLLGEALSCTKNKIVNKTNLNIRGWHEEAVEGWGSSPVVLEEMRRNGWCPRTVYTLRNQLKGTTTALYAALGYSPPADPRQHDKCNEALCLRHQLPEGTPYAQAHRPDCVQRACKPVGPDAYELASIIRSGHIPILELHEDLRISVRARKHLEEYAIVSHVWNDGFGNPEKNELPLCQIKFLLDSIKKAEDKLFLRRRGRKHFWMDTLAIPVGDAYRPERIKAIRQIHDAFLCSSCTLVVDGSLSHSPTGNRYEGIALKILACGWMQRVWTLQEAYLSEKIFFIFRDTVLDVDHLEKLYPASKAAEGTILPDAVRTYFDGILGTARQARIHQMVPKHGHNLIASIWKAMHWRTTSRKQHEAVAIATLLGLNSDSSEKATFLNESYVTGVGEFEKEKNDESIKNLWALIHDVYPGSIPAGVIFLPPPYLNHKGFTWAPSSWLTGRNAEDLDPLFWSTPVTRLDESGLFVEFPGFLLHCASSAKAQFGLLGKGNVVGFPFDNRLLEWFQIRKVDEDEPSRPLGNPQDLKQCAIILPPDQPRRREEIGLLVEVERTHLQRSLNQGQETRILHVFVLFRIWVRRDASINVEDNQWEFHREANPILGELLRHDQKWYVGSK